MQVLNQTANAVCPLLMPDCASYYTTPSKGGKSAKSCMHSECIL